MNHIDLGGELGEVARLFHRSVAAADHRQRLVAIARQRAVANSAGTHAAAVHGKTQLVGKSDPVGGCAGCDDHRMGTHRFAFTGYEHKRALREVALDDISVGDAGSEALSLLLKERHHVGAGHTVGKPRVILDFSGEHELTTR